MANTSLRRIRTFIEMYDKQNEIQVDEYTNEPIPVEGLDKMKYMVRHKREAVYYCKTLTATAARRKWKLKWLRQRPKPKKRILLRCTLTTSVKT